MTNDNGKNKKNHSGSNNKIAKIEIIIMIIIIMKLPLTIQENSDFIANHISPSVFFRLRNFHISSEMQSDARSSMSCGKRQ